MLGKQIEEKIEKIVEPYLKDLDIELVNIEYLQDGAYWYVRIYIEKSNYEENITLEDCAKVSGLIEDDIDSIINEKFYLEVSSPGIERPLKKLKDFERFVGEKVKVLLKHKIEDKRNLTGVLENVNGEILIFNIDEKKIEIPFNEVKKANLVFEF
ncbi:ribosome maturation factor RimP [Hypnocyclicus thermotrophus]|uniref:Ribosome maturation factor RimP n=1 Tax=Hypnocyclicus thermotrophus TaxID=1627895 RepID=A0AA46DYJ3_9FUSO|nr:ribosome maturation factor RimP [Hypnocyclicus thermotrophus]TDT70487.1 ribosome maturation factor RimP [Hypnocyclicus thermotrophus]